MKQLNLFKKRKKIPGKKWGRPISTHAGARKKRVSFSKQQVLHITVRLCDGLPKLRCKQGAKLIKHAIIGARAKGLDIVHFAILSNHLHLLVEAPNSQTLYTSMKSFCVRLAIHLRRWIGKQMANKKSMFRGRYHVQILKTARQVKHALQYVLLNPAKHFKRRPYIDLYTSAVAFKGWRKLIGIDLNVDQVLQLLDLRLQNFLSRPRLWLLRSGWMKS